MKHLSYGRQCIDSVDIASVVDVLKSDFLTQGPMVEEFEKALCKYTGAKFCIAVTNGTAALHLAVRALNIERNREGITTPLTFAATANSMEYNGLRTIFADIEEKSYNIDPERINNKITDNTRLLIPVHFTGRAADMKKISNIGKENSCFIIEDASHAIGSEYRNGKKVGSCCYSDMTTFSFHPVKTITTGEGGAVTTNNQELYEKLKMLRTHGITREKKDLAVNPGPWYYEMQKLGFNYRLPDINAALGVSQLSKINTFRKRRNEITAMYNDAFGNIEWLEVPLAEAGSLFCFHLYVLKIDYFKINKTRKTVMEILHGKGIGTQVHYIPVYSHPYYERNTGTQRMIFQLLKSIMKKH